MTTPCMHSKCRTFGVGVVYALLTFSHEQAIRMPFAPKLNRRLSKLSSGNTISAAITLRYTNSAV